jgi:hypothetical protein
VKFVNNLELHKPDIYLGVAENSVVPNHPNGVAKSAVLVGHDE